MLSAPPLQSFSVAQGLALAPLCANPHTLRPRLRAPPRPPGFCPSTGLSRGVNAFSSLYTTPRVHVFLNEFPIVIPPSTHPNRSANHNLDVSVRWKADPTPTTGQRRDRQRWHVPPGLAHSPQHSARLPILFLIFWTIRHELRGTGDSGDDRLGSGDDHRSVRHTRRVSRVFYVYLHRAES